MIRLVQVTVSIKDAVARLKTSTKNQSISEGSKVREEHTPGLRRPSRGLRFEVEQ